MANHAEKVWDIAIIGGGIVGCATAMLLTRHCRNSLLLLEAEDEVGSHQTRHNSGVIHSGIYYKPGTLKAKTCVQGRELLYRFCEEQGVPYERCGKLIVAVEKEELTLLEELSRRGTANGISGIKRLDPTGLKEYEPYAHGVGALYVPSTGITDFSAITRTYASLAASQEARIQTQARVVKCERRHNYFVLSTHAGDFCCKNIVNTAGLQCDRVAGLCGVRSDVKIIPFRGEYYELVPERRYLVRNLIYPVPDPRFPFLGVHFTRMIHGGIEAGPNAVLAFKREGYQKRDVKLTDIMDMVTFPGFWRMSSTYWRTGFSEFYRSFSKSAFVRSLSRLVPDINEKDLRPGDSGVRAQAVTKEGSLLDDFCVVEEPRMIHVLNAPSPAATASLAIGETIMRRALATFDL